MPALPGAAFARHVLLLMYLLHNVIPLHDLAPRRLVVIRIDALLLAPDRFDSFSTKQCVSLSFLTKGSANLQPYDHLYFIGFIPLNGAHSRIVMGEIAYVA